MQRGNNCKFRILSSSVWKSAISDGLYGGFKAKFYLLIVDVEYVYILYPFYISKIFQNK